MKPPLRLGPRHPRLLLLALLALACSDPLAPGEGRQYVDVATGGTHTCAVEVSGKVYCWGNGEDGQLGQGRRESSSAPLEVASPVAFSSVTAGVAHTCALSRDGAAWCWGWNAFYQLGDADAATDARPGRVATSVRFRQLSAGAYNTCGVSEEGEVYCWGYNRWGQNGNGKTSITIEPEPVVGELRAVRVSSGGAHSCAVTAEDRLYCWGANDYGQLGIGSTALSVTIPTEVTRPEAFRQVAAGGTHTCALTPGGAAYCWGSNEFGELGDGAAFKPGLTGSAVPVPVGLFALASSVSAGPGYSCALAENGASCWGRNDLGQLGSGSVTSSAHPQPIVLLPGWRFTSDGLAFDEIAAGGASHVCGLASGSVFCWGSGPSGQLGGREWFTNRPTRVRD